MIVGVASLKSMANSGMAPVQKSQGRMPSGNLSVLPKAQN